MHTTESGNKSERLRIIYYYIIKIKKLNKPATAVRMSIQINGVCVGSLNPIE